MPRFYFDITQDGRSLADDGGVTVNTLEDAELEAVLTVAELVAEEETEVSARNMQVVIRNAAHTPVARVTLATERFV
jgi:hypothetical protein